MMIDEDLIKKHIFQRERELKGRNVSLSISEHESTLNKGAFKELQVFKKSLEENFANLKEGRNE